MTDNCQTCGHSIEAHSGRPDKQNDKCTTCRCRRFVRLVTFTNGRATVGQPTDPPAEQPDVIFGESAERAELDELAKELREEALRADRAEAALRAVTPTADYGLFDQVSVQILLSKSPDMKVVRNLAHLLVVAVQERDAVIARMRQVLADAGAVRPQRFSLEDDPTARQER